VPRLRTFALYMRFLVAMVKRTVLSYQHCTHTMAHITASQWSVRRGRADAHPCAQQQRSLNLINSKLWTRSAVEAFFFLHAFIE